MITCRWVRSTLLLIGLLFCNILSGQRNGIQIQFDNDYITDRYYTAGLYVTYLRSYAQNRVNEDGNLLFNQWRLSYGMELYTPSIYDQESFDEMTQDRPFAAGHSLSFGLMLPSSKSKIHEYALKVGAIGAQAQGKNIQDWVHETLGFYPEIIGWEKQIADQWIVNFQYQRIKEWRLEENAAVSSSTVAGIGLANNFIRQGVDVRIGKFNELANSTWIAPRRVTKSGNFKKETFLKLGIALEYVASNIFIEGSFLDKKSAFTKDAKPLVFSGSFGIFVGRPKIDFSFECIYRGPVVELGKSHFYVAFIMGKAF